MKPLDALRVGDWIAIREEGIPRDVSSDVNEEAEIIGALFGNGGYAHSVVALSTGSKGYAEYFSALVQRHGFKGTIDRRRDGTWCVYVGGVAARSWLRQRGVLLASGRRKRLPDWLECAPSTTRVSALKGLFDTDGGFAGRDITFTTSTAANARCVQRLLFAEGVDCRLVPLWNTTPAGERRPYWRVRLMPWAHARFKQLIGFRHPERAVMLENRTPYQSRRPLPPSLASWIGRELKVRVVRVKGFTRINRARLHRACVGSASVEQVLRLLDAASKEGVDVADLQKTVTSFRWERIETIKLARDSETYDLEIGDGGDPTIDHSYIAEGIITHNSRNAGLMATATLRFIALTRSKLLDFEGLYRHRLLDAAWVSARRDEGYARWHAPVRLILQVHDSLVAECDAEDAERVAKLLAMSLDQEDYDAKSGVRVHYTAESKISRRWSKT